MLKKLWSDECGALLSAELVLIMTLVFCGVAVGVGALRTAIVQELADMAESVGALSQTYSVSGLFDTHHPDPNTPFGFSGCSGQGFYDHHDECDTTVDCAQVLPNSKCILVCIPGHGEICQ